MLPVEFLGEKRLIKFALRLVLRTNLKRKSSVLVPRRTKTEHGTYSYIFWRRRELGYIPNRLREDMGIHPFCPHIYLKSIFIPGRVTVLFLPPPHYAAEERNTLPTHMFGKPRLPRFDGDKYELFLLNLWWCIHIP